MKTSVTSIAAAGTLALILGLIAVDGAAASEKQGMECAVKAGSDGSKPATLSEAELRGKLQAAGYKQVRGLGHEGGCVEAKGIDNDGKRFEVYLHPATGEIISKQ
jgi:hypothetical protein